MVILSSTRLLDEFSRVCDQLPSFDRASEKVYLLTYVDVVEAHFCVADYFYENDYGIGGIGPRDINILV